jgi:hypothetical protein
MSMVINLPKSIEDAIPYRVRVFLNAAAKAGEEMSIDVSVCPACGASPGRYCTGAYGRTWISGMHADRREVAARWRKNNPKAWKRMKDETFRRIVRMQRVR